MDAHLPNTHTVKAAGDWELDVLGVPYGSPTQKDADGEYFTSQTRLHDDKFPYPPAVYYHGRDEDGRPAGEPAYIGKTISHEDRPEGRWYRVVLDRASEYARRVWEAAQNMAARASTGSAAHLVRRDNDGRIIEWPVIELSLFDTSPTRQPANQYAVAIPRLKSLAAETGLAELEPEATQDSGGDGSAQAVEAAQPNRTEVRTMSDDTMLTIDQISAAMKAAVAPMEARIAALEQQPVNSLPPAQKAVNVSFDSDTWKYDGCSIGELALAVDVLRNAQRRGQSRNGVSDAAVKALAMRLDSSERKTEDGYREAYGAMKSATRGLKANEIAQSTLANYGDEWVGTAYGTDLWNSIRVGTPILSRAMAYAVPQKPGAETMYFPLESGDPTWYLVGQAADLTSNPGGIPTNTVTASKLGTAQQSRTMAKIGARVPWTGELEEDSVITHVTELRRQLAESGMEMLESLIIDGDTATGASTNINDIAGTPAGSEYWLGLNGYRKLALVTNTANSRSGTTLADTDYIETMKLMGLAGKNAIDKTRTAFIVDLWTYWKSLELATLKTRDVNTQMTIESGNLTRIWGYDVLSTGNMHRPNQDATYGLKANTAGKLDLDTASNNTTGSILAVRFDQWRPGYRRQMTLETTRYPAADATEIVAMLRFGMIYRDTEASAISYNITV